jgi:peptide methionine sulfoxide reductase MsrA
VNGKAQEDAARTKIKQLTTTKAFSGPIVTTLEPLKEFYPAEDYHQDYARLHPNEPYIRIRSYPKVCKVRDKHPNLVKPAAETSK